MRYRDKEVIVVAVSLQIAPDGIQPTFRGIYDYDFARIRRLIYSPICVTKTCLLRISYAAFITVTE